MAASAAIITMLSVTDSVVAAPAARIAFSERSAHGTFDAWLRHRFGFAGGYSVCPRAQMSNGTWY